MPVFQSGFTLVELVVVILLVGILSAVAIPRFFKTSGFTERNATEEILIAFRYAQQLAMSRSGNIQMVIDGNNYRIQEVGPPITDRKSTRLLQSPDHLVCRLLLEQTK